MRSPRERMIEGATVLLATRGLQATSFSEVLAISKAPRGSIYHHFPGGKDQLIAEALEHVSTQSMAGLRSPSPRDAAEVTDRFIDMWRQLLVTTKFRAGCSIVAVTVATDSADLIERVGDVFASWRRELGAMLVDRGLDPHDAASFATTLIAACEGAVVVSRAERSIEPFDQVAAAMRQLLGSIL